jgi:hypothetical protein
MPREGIGEEHPLNDRAQPVFILVFLIVWILDSFILHITIFSNGTISLFVTIPVGVVFLVIGVYLVRESQSTVFNQEETKVIDTGVYG